MNPVDRLALFLNLHYPMYAVTDVKLSAKQGYISVNGQLISIQKVGYPLLTEDRKHISINKLWVELHDYYNAHINIVKVKSKTGKVTIIEWNNERYTYGNKSNKVGKRGMEQQNR